MNVIASKMNGIAPPHPTPPRPTQSPNPKPWRSPSVASLEIASNMNVIAPPHPTQTPYSKSGTTARAVFPPVAKNMTLDNFGGFSDI